jgi:hypothetical protein
MLLLATMLFAADPDPVKILSLSAPAPAAWKAQKPANRLRSYQFTIDAGVPDTAAAEIIVMPESSAKTDTLFPRWKAQFTPPEGKTADDIAKESKLMAGPATAYLLDLTGTWKYKERPFDPKSKEEVKPDFRVIWAVVVLKDEAAHIRLSGPQAVVAKHTTEFETWLKALK